MIRNTIIICIPLFAALLVGCGDDHPGMGYLDVRLTDSPGDFQQVNIDIQGVEVHTSGTDSASGWKSVEVTSGVYNLLDFAGGWDTLIVAAAPIPEGRISQVRLILGNDNTVMIDSMLYDLDTPSAQQSGLKLNVQADIVGGVTYSMTLDFDAASSIVERGDGTYGLKPVIRVITEAQSGAIRGVAMPLEAMPAVFALSGEDTVSSGFADSTGVFLLPGMPAGTYTVSFDPKDPFQSFDQPGVTVTQGEVTVMDTVTLVQ